MVAHPEYPCLGARSVFRREAATTVVLDDLTDTSPGGSLDRLGQELRAFARDVDARVTSCRSSPASAGRRSRTSRSSSRRCGPRSSTSTTTTTSSGPTASPRTPGNPHFAFSVAATAFFVVGLHPQASRIARRAPLPTLVFNLHEQFERMRADGRFERMRDTIRRRDTDLQGAPNPMAVDHGASSEARQYSGRAVPTDWEPPFAADLEPRTTPTDDEEHE